MLQSPRSNFLILSKSCIWFDLLCKLKKNTKATHPQCAVHTGAAEHVAMGWGGEGGGCVDPDRALASNWYAHDCCINIIVYGFKNITMQFVLE